MFHLVFCFVNLFYQFVIWGNGYIKILIDTFCIFDIIFKFILPGPFLCYFAEYFFSCTC